MNSTTKKFLSAIFATAIVFTQAGAAVSAATSSPWGTSTPQIAQSFSPKTTSKDYGNSSYWSEKDKYGYAYPYSYYYYASNPTAKKVYIQIYEAVHERKSSIKISVKDEQYLKKTFKRDAHSFCSVIRNSCSELYYLDYCTVERDDNYAKITFDYDYSEKEIAAYEKKLKKVVADFDNYLEKNNVKTTKEFFSYTLSYLSKNVKPSKGSTIISALIDGHALCIGYADAFSYLCRLHGISTAPEGLTLEEGNHEVSIAVYKNTWYVFDPAFSRRSERQMLTDSQYKEVAKVEYVSRNLDTTPTCNGKAVKPPVAKTTSSTSKPSTSTQTKPSTSTQTKPTSDTAEETFIEYHYTDFDTFSFIVEGNIKGKRNKGYTYYKITVPDGKLDLTIKYLKQMKADGTITYTSLSKGKTYVKITL